MTWTLNNIRYYPVTPHASTCGISTYTFTKTKLFVTESDERNKVITKKKVNEVWLKISIVITTAEFLGVLGASACMKAFFSVLACIKIRLMVA